MSFDDCQAITVITGEDRSMILRVVDKLTQEPLDVTAATAINARFKNANQTILTKTLSLGVTIVSGPAGKIKVDLSVAETALLNVRDDQDFEVEFVIAGKTTVVQFLKAISVKSRVV